jgi:hypothetical protein
VFASHDLRARIAAEGRALVEARYAWPQVAAQFSSLLERAVQPSPPIAVPLVTPAAS